MAPASTMERRRSTCGSTGTVLSHDSMVTVRLSEPPSLSIVTTSLADELSRPIREQTPSVVHLEADISKNVTQIPTTEECESDRSSCTSQKTAAAPNNPLEQLHTLTTVDDTSSIHSDTPDDVNWEELEKTEELEPRDGSSDESTALLLARLEQENNMLAKNPKSAVVAGTTRRGSRPPSMQQLKKMVNEPTPPALRYSLVTPPLMTDLEFYAAIVQDYKRTAQCLPTLLSKKIRSGIPPPLRGVVWQSMAGARDRVLEEQFERLCGESSPYEGMIGKDIGRSFPGVEMFRDPLGDGQRMLGRVLKCFSLYDQKIGYCQGLGFLVGPLLMHMDDRAAFCILVRLMENYDLRSCFLPDLSGLHVRIYQFAKLLKSEMPELAAHLEALQVEPAYVSQWFLSFFAVTCPLPMLFRIYDVIFAEGASTTIMRVALSLMQKNESKLLACSEFEDVMQLLLSRGLWDCYHYNADEFVDDFVSLTLINPETLQNLETSFRESQEVDTKLSTIGSAASRFLGRLWAGSAAKSTTSLSPALAAPSMKERPASFIPRSPSKQSIASTLNSTEGSSDSIVSVASTNATTVSRDSANSEESSTRAESTVFTSTTMTGPRSKDKDLHSQIEDLLTVVSELQREGAILATQLQKEREERDEDRTVVKALLDGLRTRIRSETIESSDSEETVTPNSDETGSDDASLSEAKKTETAHDKSHMASLFDATEERFCQSSENRRSSFLQTKSQLRDEVSRTKEQLAFEVGRGQDLGRKLDERDHEIVRLKEQVKENHSHLRSSHQDKQRLEKQLQELRSRQDTSADASHVDKSAGKGGLRELRLGSTFSKRSSSLNAPTVVEPVPDSPGALDRESLLLELVQAKTAEAVAKQEAEEAKAKLESLRKLLSAGHDAAGHRPSPSVDRTNTLGIFAGNAREKSVTPPPSATSSGGFWSGWGKRSISTSEKFST